MKLNNKGFSIYEFITTVALLSIIFLFLFQIVFFVAEVQNGELLDYNIINDKMIIVSNIEQDLIEDELTDIDDCGDNCLVFTYDTKGDVELKVNTTENYIIYGNIAVKIHEKATVGDLSYTIANYSVNASYTLNAMINIEIPITPSYDNGFRETFDININHQYDYNHLNIGISDIALSEGNVMYLNLNETFTEPGYTEYNLNDIVTEMPFSIDVSTPGTYYKTYSSLDEYDNPISVERTVIVLDN